MAVGAAASAAASRVIMNNHGYPREPLTTLQVVLTVILLVVGAIGLTRMHLNYKKEQKRWTK